MFFDETCDSIFISMGTPTKFSTRFYRKNWEKISIIIANRFIFMFDKRHN